MSHRHYVDREGAPKPCVEVSPAVCLTPTSVGFFVHFDPPHPSGIRQMGGVEIREGLWAQTGTLEGGDLTITPSIKVSTTARGREVELLHGWVTAGKWVPA